MTSQTIAQRLGEPDRPTFSFEFFPPSDAAGAFVLLDTVVNLRELRPDWVSVTYGATGATRERTFGRRAGDPATRRRPDDGSP